MASKVPSMGGVDLAKGKLKALIAFRILLVTLLLGSFMLFRIKAGVFPQREAILHLFGIIYFLSIIYLFLLSRIKTVLLAYTQFVIDVLCIIALIYLTGGIESWFSFLLIPAVIGTGIVIGRRASIIIAALGSILYGMLIEYQFYGLLLKLPFNPGLTEKDFIYNVFSNVLALFVSAYLTGYLSSRLEKTTRRLEKKVHDFRDLAIFNREVIESVPSGLVTTDMMGDILFLNKAGEAIIGVSRVDVLGTNIRSLFTFLEDLDEVDVRSEGYISTGGSRKIIGMTLSRMKNSEGEQIGLIGIFQDLTHIKSMQEEIRRKEKWAAIGELSANIAHEIRNPLASLRGSIEMMGNSKITKDQKSSLMQIAVSEMDRLNRIVTDFLTYSRPARHEPKKIELNTVLEKICELLGKSMPEKIGLVKDLPERIMLSADEQKLHQVFLNLALNAFEAMPQGGTLKIVTRKNGKFARVDFADTGCGVSPENREKIFFPFFTTKDTGTGLGLSIAMRAVEDHGGTIKLASSQAGSTFSIFLPLDKSSNGKENSK